MLRGCAKTDIRVRIARRIVDIRIEDSRFAGIVVVAANEESFDYRRSNLIMWSFFFFGFYLHDSDFLHISCFGLTVYKAARKPIPASV